MENKSILVVEDDSMARMIISRIARSLVNDVIEVNNGDEAITYLKNCEPVLLPSLLLVDIYMPYMDGIVFCRKLKELNLFSLERVIIISAADRKVERDVIDELGIGGFLQKPFSPNKVRQELSSRL
ncbi:MAG: response regulator [Acidobacteria bacterium]|nr:response regulator [Acidobacteriota bacterium]MCA1638851.1 response regulator [Acidobacteriota bacterium]